MKIKVQHSGFMEKFQSINSGWLASISLMSGIVGQVYLYLIKNVPVGLFFFIVAAVCLIIGLKKSGKETEDSKNIFSVSFNPSLKTEIILLFFVLIIAAFMRLFMIDSIPSGCFSDEALNGLTALDILNGRSLPVYIGPQAPNNAAVFMYYIAVIFKLFGIGATQLRLTPAFLGILAVPAFYFLIRYIGGAGPALTGSFILALMRWHIIFSRIAFHAAFAVVAVIFVLYFALRSFYSKKTYDFIFLGITFSFSFYTYQSARLCFFVLIIFMIYVFFYERNFYRKNLRKIALAVAVAVVVFVPMGIYIANHFNAFFSRQAEVSIVNKNNYNFKDSIQEQTWRSQKTWYNMLFYNIQAGMLMFNYKGDANERHNLPGQPELDFFTGIFALIGFLYALTRLSNPVYFFFTTSFIIFMCAGFFTIESPQSLRTVAAIPCVAFFALVFIFNFLSCFKSAKSVSIAFVVIFIMLLLSAYNNFLDFGKLCQDG